MDSKTSALDKSLKIGDVFTPLEWGKFGAEKFRIFHDWLNGASVFDPTMGPGKLLESLVSYGLVNGYSVEELPLNNLYGNELNSEYYRQALNSFKEKFSIDMSANFYNQDIFELNTQKFDIIYGNPPWQNFVDLPDSYKDYIKSKFFEYDLIGNSQSLLLGGSRIDIAALVIQCVMQDFLIEQGNAYFFMPLSLFLNDGANQYFRTYQVNSVSYAPVKILDFNDCDVFGNIATRYGFVHFKRDKQAQFPIPFQRYEKGKWLDFIAKPLFTPTDPLSIIEPNKADPLQDFTPIALDKSSTPRQGVNTCGANSVFFFKSYEVIDDQTCKVDDEFELPLEFVHPLLTSNNFKETSLVPNKWVLLPYSKSGKPLSKEAVKSLPKLENYLKQFEGNLEKRKGTMIGTWLKKGYWWSLLGVGPYSFAPYKVVWEAYGKKEFRPIIVEGKWQANQSLQAFIPVNTKDEALRILDELLNPAVEAYLLSLKMEGTMNWAQPGKIKKLLKFREATLTLFS